MNKTDMQLKQEIEEELRWDPRINPAQIGVTVEKGAVAPRHGRHLPGEMGSRGRHKARRGRARRGARSQSQSPR